MLFNNIEIDIVNLISKLGWVFHHAYKVKHFLHVFTETNYW